MGREKFLTGLLFLLLALCFPAAGYSDITYVIDQDAGTNSQGALFRVDPVSGARTVLSDFGAGANQGVDPIRVAVETSGQILVVDANAGTGGVGTLFRVDPISGARTVLSDFGAGANQGENPSGVAVETSGQILVVDWSAGTNSQGALFRVDPVSGARTVLSDFGAGANQGDNPRGVVVETSGQILVIDDNAGTGGVGALFRVDPVSGARTVLSDFGAGVNQGENPWGVVVETSGQILVIDVDAGTNSQGALFRVDPVSGARTVLSDFGVGANQGVDPGGVAIETSGQILVIDPNAGTGDVGALFRVDPVSGARTVLSDFGAGTNQGVSPFGLAVFQQQEEVTPVPTMTEWGMIIFVVLSGLGAVIYLRRYRKTES